MKPRVNSTLKRFYILFIKQLARKSEDHACQLPINESLRKCKTTILHEKDAMHLNTVPPIAKLVLTEPFSTSVKWAFVKLKRNTGKQDSWCLPLVRKTLLVFTELCVVPKVPTYDTKAIDWWGNSCAKPSSWHTSFLHLMHFIVLFPTKTML